MHTKLDERLLSSQLGLLFIYFHSPARLLWNLRVILNWIGGLLHVSNGAPVLCNVVRRNGLGDIQENALCPPPLPLCIITSTSFQDAARRNRLVITAQKSHHGCCELRLEQLDQSLWHHCLRHGCATNGDGDIHFDISFGSFHRQSFGKADYGSLGCRVVGLTEKHRACH